MRQHISLYTVMHLVMYAMTILAILSFFHEPMGDFSATWLADVIGSKIICAMTGGFAWVLGRVLKTDFFAIKDECREA
ncbi:MAG: hypothetical protein K2M69_05915 [Muribaculaceae bacterium]|nr:hypothetical protein [Muribaculaceae bacterium]